MQFDNLSRWQDLLAVARGDQPADLLLKNARIVNVFSGEIMRGDLAIYDGRIAGVGDYEAHEIVDLEGSYLAPGFIEGHIHIESSKLTPPRFAEAIIPHGTTAVVADPHEIGNVWGVEGIRYMLRLSRNLPLDIFYMLPSCVPATSMETAGAILLANDLRSFLSDSQVLGIAELMNFPGAYMGDAQVLSKAALTDGFRPIDGHSPGLSGKPLAAYLAVGPSTDHECSTLEEAREKLRLGMRIMIREGSTARNLKTLLPIVTPATERRCMFVSDDRRPGDLLEQGHLDYTLRLAVAEGMDPVTAIRMVTLNTAEAFGLNDRGGIRPGWRADLVAISDLESFHVLQVWKDGKSVAAAGKLTVAIPCGDRYEARLLSVPPLTEEDFQVADRGKPIRVIGIIPDQIVTRNLVIEHKGVAGRLHPSPEQDLAKLVVIERHTGSGRTATAFVQGLGLRTGALGSTVAHDSHNIIIAGMDDRSILTAAMALIKMGGGQVAVEADLVLAELSLPIAGLMTDLTISETAIHEDALIAAARKLGCSLGDPFMALSFLALPVIPELKLTDYGLVDVGKFKHVDLYE